jgi:hypothetical protein
MELDEATAEVIMGAIAFTWQYTFQELKEGVMYDLTKQEYKHAEKQLLRTLYATHPEVVNRYRWLEGIQELIGDS